MDPSFIIMWVGFILAGYSVVGNDSIQTLGTFLSSNEQRPWYVLWLYAGTILAATLFYGWYSEQGIAYGRLEGYPFIEDITWPYLLPPLVLMVLTRTGIPVSTSFLILTFFKPKGLLDMTFKSVLGYMLAFAVAILVWQLITRMLDKRFIENPIKPREQTIWTALQWISTGFLWTQWLIQDFANIYVYLPRGNNLDTTSLFVSLTILLIMLAYIFWSRGGAIQEIVKAKTNTVDIRSATIIDFLYAVILLFFKEFNNVPMSTTWVFLGLLGGREIAIRYQLAKTSTEAEPTAIMKTLALALNVVVLCFVGYIVYMRDQISNAAIGWFAILVFIRIVVFYFGAKQQGRPLNHTYRGVGSDLAKVTFGLVISVALVYLMQFLTGIGLAGE